MCKTNLNIIFKKWTLYLFIFFLSQIKSNNSIDKARHQQSSETRINRQYKNKHNNKVSCRKEIACHHSCHEKMVRAEGVVDRVKVFTHLV